nr:MAG: hypothetical protein DIU70_12815 [Bacillota bacterium]
METIKATKRTPTKLTRQATALLLAFGLLSLLAGLAVGCSSRQPQTEGPPQVLSGEVTVEMRGIRYVPAEITVRKGTRITFVNKDGLVHDVVQVALKDLGKAEPGFNSGPIQPGESWSIVMEEPGTYPILCTQMGHYTAGMVGTITVVE